jgi:hypothetical protein
VTYSCQPASLLLLQFKKCHKLWHFSRDAAARLLSIVKALCLFFIRTLLTQRFHFVSKLGDDCLQILNGGDLFADWLWEFPDHTISRYANGLLDAAHGVLHDRAAMALAEQKTDGRGIRPGTKKAT